LIADTDTDTAIRKWKSEAGRGLIAAFGISSGFLNKTDEVERWLGVRLREERLGAESDGSVCKSYGRLSELGVSFHGACWMVIVDWMELSCSVLDAIRSFSDGSTASRDG